MSALKVSGIGRLTSDVELKEVNTTKGKQSLCNLSIAFDNGKDRDATFKNFECWGKTAENASKYLAKGSQVAIEATLHNNKYEKDGNTVYSDRLVVNSLEYLSKGKGSSKEVGGNAVEEEKDLPF